MFLFRKIAVYLDVAAFGQITLVQSDNGGRDLLEDLFIAVLLEGVGRREQKLARELAVLDFYLVCGQFTGSETHKTI